MKINNFSKKTINFFKKNGRRYGCTAIVEKMLLSSINEEQIEKERKIPVIDSNTQHVPVYDTDILYVRDVWEKEEREKQERFERAEKRRLRNRPPRRK